MKGFYTYEFLRRFLRSETADHAILSDNALDMRLLLFDRENVAQIDLPTVRALVRSLNVEAYSTVFVSGGSSVQRPYILCRHSFSFDNTCTKPTNEIGQR
jgi:hypothetical protein